MLSSIIREVKYEIVECSRDDALLRGRPRTSWLLAKTGKTFFGQKVPHREHRIGGPLYFFHNILYYYTKSQNNNNLYHRRTQDSAALLQIEYVFCPGEFFKILHFYLLLLPKSCFYGIGLRLVTYTTFFSFLQKVRKLYKSNRCIFQRNAFI